jgi:hypothetical protein
MLIGQHIFAARALRVDLRCVEFPQAQKSPTLSSGGSASGAPTDSQCAERRSRTQLLMIVVLVSGVRVLPLFAVIAMYRYVTICLTTPAGRMMFHVISAMAEFERELIRERVKAGLAHARSKGRVGGRPKVKL